MDRCYSRRRRKVSTLYDENRRMPAKTKLTASNCCEHEREHYTIQPSFVHVELQNKKIQEQRADPCIKLILPQ